MTDDYEVGYGNPPKHSRFEKGRSGNKKGRPKGHRNFKTDLIGTLETPVQLQENGKTKTVSTQQAMLFRLREKALKGDARALDRLIELARVLNDDEMAGETAGSLSSNDQAILERYARQRVPVEPTHDEKELNGTGRNAGGRDADE